MKTFARIISLGFAALVPAVASAAGAVTVTNSSPSLYDVTMNNLFPFILGLIPIMTGFALLGFVWGLTRFIWNAGDEKKREEGRNVMIWGILAFFVFLSIIGITNVLQDTLGVGGNPTINPPSANPASYPGFQN